jgi:hypothetical protein
LDYSLQQLWALSVGVEFILRDSDRHWVEEGLMVLEEGALALPDEMLMSTDLINLTWILGRSRSCGICRQK